MSVQSNPRRHRLSRRIAAALAIVYLGSYVAYRETHREPHIDGRMYLLFDSRFAYLLYRPLCYLDATLTGMHFHLGPHR